MPSAMEALWRQALNTFAGRSSVGYRLCQKNFENLRALMNKITADDVKLDKQVLEFVEIQSAPMCVIDIFENQDITIAIFILKHGITMPMHDHPGMHGLLKVITGTVKIDSYTMQIGNDCIIRPHEEITAIKHPEVFVCDKDPACILTPCSKNLHEISCIEGPAAFLDILSPPYEVDEYGKGPRPCTFFGIIMNKDQSTESAERSDKVKLVVTESPSDFYSRSLKYVGPPLR